MVSFNVTQPAIISVRIATFDRCTVCRRRKEEVRGVRIITDKKATPEEIKGSVLRNGKPNRF